MPNVNTLDSNVRRELLGSLLKSVSRSFYLTLRVLPAGVREPIGLAYLLARAADTIADTSILPSDVRLALLLAFRERLNGAHESGIEFRIEKESSTHLNSDAERNLLKSLRPAFELLDGLNDFDKREVRKVVTTLTTGMELDLLTFPNESSGQLLALKSFEELDRYTFMVAGCVGEFWTIMTCRYESKLRDWNIAEMSATGIRFGKALQYTNILRDVPKDLRIGRCYLPNDLLTSNSLTAVDLLDSRNGQKARPALAELVNIALAHYEEARDYILAIPVQCARLRLACLWPALIGLPTLTALGRNSDWLNPDKKSKVPRAQVKRILATSLPAVGSDVLLNHWIDSNILKVKRAFELPL